jgi:hypothetical protein
MIQERERNRVVLLLALMCGLCGTNTCFADEDTVATALNSAVEEFKQAQVESERKLLDQLEKKIQTAQTSGDLELYEKLSDERERYLSGGVLPQSASVRTYEASLRQARSKLNSAYLTAIKAYTSLGSIEKAKALQQELNSLKAATPDRYGTANSRSYWGHASGYFVRGPGTDWFERYHDGKPMANLFQEISSTNDYVELRHTSHPVTVRLYSKTAMVMDKLKGHRDFVPFYNGQWLDLRSR